MTLVILYNGTVAMTGTQTTILPSARLQTLILGLGLDPEHCRVLSAHPRHTAENAAALGREIEHRGLSVVILARECLEVARQKKAIRVAASKKEAVPA